MLNKNLYYLWKFFRRGEVKLYKNFIISCGVKFNVKKWTFFSLFFMYLYVDIFDIVLRYHLLRCCRFGLDGYRFYFEIEHLMVKFGIIWSIIYLFLIMIYCYKYYFLYFRLKKFIKN